MSRKSFIKKTLIAGAVAVATSLASVTASAQDTIRVAFIEGLSGPFANAGDAALKNFVYVSDLINEQGGINGKKIEIIPYDNKSSPQESLQILQKVADQGIQYITQGNGSHVAGALIQGVNKHNNRNPDSPIVFLNYAAVNPDFTNEDCSFWHFRFDAHSGMKLQAITDYMAKQEDVKKVFLINQDYSHGQAVSRIAKEMLARKRPDVEIVGDVLHPIGKVKDFSPYVSQIKASGADTVITGNWGNDLSLLIKAANDAGLEVNFQTYYGGVTGTPTAIGEAGAGRVKMVAEFQENLPTRFNATEYEKISRGLKDRYPEIEFLGRAHTQMNLLAMAMEKAGTTEPVAVAKALEGLEMDHPFGQVKMRSIDHQVLQPLFISTFTKDYLAHDTEDTGLGWKMDVKIESEETAVPTTCEMKRPN
ncbi:branched-chain amino acid ABC transporter substrate-binding protein [Ectothiorhodospiraceae bacterium WFHF3C12]|nr:branched-chain amino acid ABC transporter substrate-binding protein [Ectothiorhodospiraceae bacterium WFHF3C12]